MFTQRTGGMTAVGILNIVFGSLGSLVALLAIVGGGLVAAVGAAGEAESAGTDAEGIGAAVATGGMLVMVIGLVYLLCMSLLIFDGIGVLKLKPWGRTLSIACGAGIALLSGYSIITGEFSIMTLGMCGYGLLLVGLFMTENWKAAFTGDTVTAGLDMTASTQRQMRDAA
jgi:hypothetical protein